MLIIISNVMYIGNILKLYKLKFFLINILIWWVHVK